MIEDHLLPQRQETLPLRLRQARTGVRLLQLLQIVQ